MARTPAQKFETAHDLVDVLEEQHAAIRGLFDSALSPEKGIDAESFVRLRGLVAVHETVEEMIVHPWSRRASDTGRVIANTRLAEELTINHDLERLESITVGTPEFIVGLAALRSAMLEHCRLEEEQEFPLLSGALAPEDGRRMGLAVGMSEWVAPPPARPRAESTISGPTLGCFADIAHRVRDILAAV